MARLFNDALLPDEAALLAAQLASEATTELLRFAREGAASPASPFTDETVSPLAEATLHALRIEPDPIFDPASAPDEYAREAALKARLATALRDYIEERL